MPSVTWEKFCQWLHDRFDRDQHELLIRQLFNVRQQTTVSAYIATFSELVDQLTTYSPNADPLFYTMRFIDGLRHDIKAVVLVQRPPSFKTACRLALLQEEVGTDSPPAAPHGGDWPSSFKHRPSTSAPLPLPPPPRIAKPVQHTPAAAPATPPPAPSSLAAIKAYRRALGLCYKCNAKWSKDHVCAPEVLLAVEALWSGLGDEVFSSPEALDAPSEQICLALSKAATQGCSSVRSVLFQGTVQNQSVTILLDSGSSSSFISTHVSQLLANIQLDHVSCSVQVAGGGLLQSPAIIRQLQWCIGDCVFHSDFRVLDLASFGMVVGMDWLVRFSPMQVHWSAKWLSIPYNGQHRILQGIGSTHTDQFLLHLAPADSDGSASSSTVSVPAPIHRLLSEYSLLFEPPTTLPPSRDCNHQIPLVPGAQPFSIRAYRYPPALKDEIELQVQDMLQQGLIRPSASPFSSPVLLVRKKDGSFRLCADFRQLNAITRKSKFPVPVIDQLMDELSQACWFSKLDLRASFHQILLQEGEEFKTAFQTHLGQYEFRVMAFGLTGAPGTFQGAMNHTLAGGLRKFVIVFFDDILIYNRSLAEHVSHLRQVFQWLQADSWKLKLSKCTFA